MKINEMIILKQRIDNNYVKLQKKYFLTKFMLKRINDLIYDNASDEEICEWLKKNENIIFGMEYFLNIVEQEHTRK